MKKMRKIRVFSFLMAILLTVCVGMIPAGAVSVGPIIYQNTDGDGVVAPYVGDVVPSVTFTDNDGGELQLLTAAYDTLSKTLADVVVSDVSTASDGTLTGTESLHLDTLDGYTVKSFVWDKKNGNLIPCTEVQSGLINLYGEIQYQSKGILQWEPVGIAEWDTYTVFKNGQQIKTGLAQNAAGWVDNSAKTEDVYCVCAMKNGEIVAASKQITLSKVEISLPEVPVKPVRGRVEAGYAFDATVGKDGVTVSGTAGNKAAKTYTNSNLQISGDPSLLKLQDGTWYGNNANRCWTIIEAPDAAKTQALFMTYYTRSTANSNQVSSNVMLTFGEELTGRECLSTLSFEYWDNSSKITIEYTSGVAEDGTVSTTKKTLTGQGTNTWKTYLITDAALYAAPQWNQSGTNDANVKISGATGDFYVRRITAKANEDGEAYAEYRAAAQTGFMSLQATQDISLYGYEITTERPAAITDDTQTADYYINGTSDTAYYTEEKDGQWTATTHRYMRIDKSGDNYKRNDGYLSFALNETLFRPTMNEIVIEVEYYDSGEGTEWTPKVQYFGTDTGGGTVSSENITVSSIDSNWKMAVLTISDATFNKIDANINNGKGSTFGNGTPDFRFTNCASGGYIRTIRVMTKNYYEQQQKAIDAQYAADYTQYLADYQDYLDALNGGVDPTPNADSLYPNGASASFGEKAQTANGVAVADDLQLETRKSANDRTMEYVQKDGVWAVSTTSYKGYNGKDPETGEKTDIYRDRLTYLYFSVDPQYLSGAAYAEIQIEYWDDSTYTMQLSGSDGSSSQYVSVSQEGTGTWNTAVFRTDKILFQEGAYNGNTVYGKPVFNLRLGAENEGENSKQLIIKSIKVGNISQRTSDIIVDDGIPSVYIAADSIAADYSAKEDRRYDGVTERWGWGELLPLSGNIVENYASPGASTRTFGDFETIINRLQKNDYVLISFGHNDSMTSKLVELEDYKDNLRRVAARVTEKCAIPVIITSIPTVSRSEEPYTVEKEETAIEPYRQAALEVAREMNLISYDLGTAFAEILNGCSTSEDMASYYAPDNTTEGSRLVHLSKKGAQCVADLICAALKADPNIRVLDSYITK